MALRVKNLPANAGDVRDTGSVRGSRRSPGEGNGDPLQYSCLENLMDRGAWRAMVHKVAKSRTRLKQLSSSSKKVEGYHQNVNVVMMYYCRDDMTFIWYFLIDNS